MHNKSTLFLCWLASLSFVSTIGLAKTQPANDSVLAQQSNQTLHPVSALLSAQNSALIDPNQTLHTDNPFGVPTFLWAQTAVPQSSAAVANGHNVENVARQHLSRYAALYRLSKTAHQTAKLHTIHHSADGVVIAQFTQQMDGVEVLGEKLNLLMDKNLTLHAISGYLSPHVVATAQAVKAQSQFSLTMPDAISAAFYDLHAENIPAAQFVFEKQQGNYLWYGWSLPLPNTLTHILDKAVRVKKVFYSLPDHLEPAYYLELSTHGTESDDKDAYAYVISARNGRLLSRSNQVKSEASSFSYRVWADPATLIPYDSPLGNNLTPLLTGSDVKTFAPVDRHLLTLGCSLISTCDPWLPANATETSGNNTKVYADLKRPNGFGAGDVMGKISSAATFDYPYQFNLFDNSQHQKQLQAVLTQAFYTTNFVHDWLYDHGFNELSGNGQQDNFQRGGLGNDAMRVEVNDYSGIDNANMNTPADGAAGTMQLYLWTHTGKKQFLAEFNGSKHNYPITTADFGAQRVNLSGKNIVLVNDGVAVNATGGVGSTADGCQTPFVNAASLVGAIALIDRGDCLFAEKAKAAQDAGAIAVLIANNSPDAMIPLGGSGNRILDNSIKIPAFGIAQKSGAALKQALVQTTVTANLQHFTFPPYNGALDNTVVIHEWGHFLSERLIASLANQQGGSMGEGWSDFLALLAIVKETDRAIAGNEQFQAPYAVGQYANADQLLRYPFGIRRYPYSTDLSKNPLTFKHISDGVALPVGIAAAPGVAMDGADNSEVHNSGEVWTTMLWEVYAALLNDSARLTFSQAQSRMLDYLVASLKITPQNPTFLEARDALLAVAKARDVADYRLFWQAFAKRGAGVYAKAPRRYLKTQVGAVEDFTTP